jgi:DNA-binding NarL/FixJ family response regulator
LTVTTASVASAPPNAAPTTAAVVGAESLLRRRAAELLAGAGFRVGGAPAPGGLVVVVEPGDATRLRALRGLAERDPGAGILAVVPAGTPNASLRRALLAGAAGIVLDDELEPALVATARATLAGQLAVPRALGRQIAPRPLSYREKEIIALVVRGLTNRQIAGRLYLAESTVKTHISSAFRKLDVSSRAEAAARLEDPDAGFGILTLADDAAA